MRLSTKRYEKGTLEAHYANVVNSLIEKYERNSDQVQKGFAVLELFVIYKEYERCVYKQYKIGCYEEADTCQNFDLYVADVKIT